MKRMFPAVFASGVLLGVLGLAAQSAPEREKVAEGQYTEWSGNSPNSESTQSWTLWRVADGYELEDHLPPNKAAVLVAAMGESRALGMTPELRQDIQNAVTPTEISLSFSKEKSLVVLTLRGVRLSERKPKVIDIARCEVLGERISCKGVGGKAHIRASQQQVLFCSQPFPLFFIPAMLYTKLEQNHPIPLQLAILDADDKKVALTEVSGQIVHLGKEQLVIGQYTLQAEKYVLTMVIKSDTAQMLGNAGRGLGNKTVPGVESEQRQVTLWASQRGIVFAMEDTGLVGGLRIVLTHYKKYSEF